MAPADVPRALLATIELLEGGDAAQAEIELRKIIAADPSNRLALSLMRQIREEPVAIFGRESFNYKVAPGESLSSIARRFLGDVHLFYGLARYNGIKVPRTLSGGQLIKVPGKASTVVPAPAPSPAAASPSAAPAPAPASPASPAPPAGPSEAQKKAAELGRLTRAARAAFARQDLDGAIRNWDAVLVIDPDNANARTEGQKAKALKIKLEELQKKKEMK